MIKIRRIFWKIFFAFWVANLLILMATVYAVVTFLESVSVKERQRAMLEVMATRIVQQYENENLPGIPIESEQIFGFDLVNRDIFNSLPLLIFDSDNELVFESNVKPSGRKRNEVEFSIFSPHGHRYRVYSETGMAPRFVVKEFQKLNSFQFLFIFLASAAVSLVLSWSIARPLKKLGHYSRRYAMGENDLEIDNTLLKRGDEVGDLARDVNFMQQEIAKNIRAQKQLLHDVSHELRAPLARLQATAGILQQKHSDNAEHIDRIDRECERINQLIQQILDFSRLEHVEQEASLTNIVDLIREEIEDVAFEYQSTVIEFEKKPSALLWSVYPDILARAFNNVLSNACKYSPAGEKVEVSLSQSEQGMVIEVRDHGPGIPESEITQVLEPFYRAGNKMHTEGYGLGLSIVRRAIELCGGSFQLSNRLNGGLIAQIMLPSGSEVPAAGKPGPISVNRP